MRIEEDTYIYKKEIDWSALNLGINIPISIQVIFHNLISSKLNRGDVKNIKIFIDGELYNAKLININFDKNKYPTHKELLQIRYSPNSEISKKLKSIFTTSYEYLKYAKENLINKKQHIAVPDNFKEYLVLYTTEFEDVYLMDYITNDDIITVNQNFQSLSEEELELSINYYKKDTNANILLKPQIIKIRKIDKSISDNLKLLYDFKCQICGKAIGVDYDGVVTEAHHIEPFIKSLNNKPVVHLAQINFRFVHSSIEAALV